MRTRIIVSALFLWGLPLLSPVMRAGDHDAAISVAVNNMVRHEKRFLSTTDVFDIGIYPEQNLLIVSARVDDDHHNHFSAVVSPKDTSIIPVFIKDTCVPPALPVCCLEELSFHNGPVFCQIGLQGTKVKKTKLSFP